MTIAHEVEVDRPAANGRGAVGWRPTAGRCEMWARCGVEQNAYDQNINELATFHELERRCGEGPAVAVGATHHGAPNRPGRRCPLCAGGDERLSLIHI